MAALVTASIILACMVSGILLGLRLRGVLPDHHTRDESKDIVKTGAGTMATLVALIIGLLVSSAKSSYDTASASITQGGAKIITLNYYLTRYGPDAKAVRELLRGSVAAGIKRVWPDDGAHHPVLAELERATGMDGVYDGIRELSPASDSQQYLKSQALQLGAELMQSRWMFIEQSQNKLPTTFLIVLTFWLTVLFGTLGLLAPRNLTAMFSLFICAISMAGAIFLILELNQPLEGIIKVSGAPLIEALSIIGK